MTTKPNYGQLIFWAFLVIMFGYWCSISYC